MAKKEPVKLTKYERARILGSRALQIAQGAPFLVKLTDADLKELKDNPVEIAKKELAADVIRIEVTKPMPLKKDK